MPAIIEVIDRHGRRRRLRPGEVPADGETVHIPMMLMDHGGFHPYFSDGSRDFTSPHRPGYRFADTNDAARIAASYAYEAMRERMSNAWRRKNDVQADADDTPPTRTRTASLDELRAAAEGAYREKCRRLQNAWKQR